MSFPKSFIQPVSRSLTHISASPLPLYKGTVIARPWMGKAAARLCKYSLSEECIKVAFNQTLGSSSQLKARCPLEGRDRLSLLRTACENPRRCASYSESLWQRKLRMGRDETRAGTGKRGTWEPTVIRCWGRLPPGSQTSHLSLVLYGSTALAGTQASPPWKVAGCWWLADMSPAQPFGSC